MAMLCMKGFEISKHNVSSKKIIQKVNKHYKIVVKCQDKSKVYNSILCLQNDGHDEFCYQKDT
jgi:hypothetical protein